MSELSHPVLTRETTEHQPSEHRDGARAKGIKDHRRSENPERAEQNSVKDHRRSENPERADQNSVKDHRRSENPERADQPRTPAPRHFTLRPYPPLQRDPDPARTLRAQALAKAMMLRVRRWRVEQCLTREALAELSAVPPSTIKRAERSGVIGFQSLVAILDALGLADDFASLLLPRRNNVPSVVLASRGSKRQRGRRNTRDRAMRRGRA